MGKLQIQDKCFLLFAATKMEFSKVPMNKTGFIYHPQYLKHDTEPHPENPGRLEAIRDKIKSSDIYPHLVLPEPRPAFVLERGRYDARRQEVFPGTPSSIMAFGEQLPPNRLGLAKWVTDPDHPLTARVAVNRLWMIVFGRGLVVTAENFGSQGATPTHPDLLDALALDFIESGWDVKKMMKRMVTSATYRQRSGVLERRRGDDPTPPRE